MIVEPSEPDTPPGQTRDRELVEAHCRGDQQAFATIVSSYYRVLLAQAERRLGRGGDADDAVQETFERAFRALCRFGERGEYRLGAWLSRILSNVCHDHSGRAAVERGLPDRVASREVPAADAFESVSDPVVLRAVRDAIDALPSSQRDTFLLKEMDGLSYPQVAAHLDITEDNARARVHRARSALRRSLAITRTAIGSLVAIPIGLRSLFRRGPASPTVPGSELTTAPSTAATLATQVAVSPVGQAVVALAPSGGLRGSIVAGLAGLAVTGALAVPAVTSGSSSQPTPSVDRTAQEVGAPVPTPTSTFDLPPAPADVGQAPAGVVQVPTETSVPSVVPPKEAMAADQGRADWWNDDTYKTALADDDKHADAGPSTGDAPAGEPVPTCGPADALISGANATRVVSTLDLPRSVRLDPTDRGYEFSYGTTVAATQEELTVTGEICRDGGSVSLDLRLVTATGSVRLTGRSVYDQDGVWLFRGSATHEEGATFEWATSRFIAKFHTAQLTSTTLIGELSVAFQADAAHGEDHAQGEPILINGTAPATGSTDDAPQEQHPPSDSGTNAGDHDATEPSGDLGGSGGGDGGAVPPSTTTTAPSVQGGTAA